MGSRDEFREMLHFMEKHKLRPVLDRTYPIEQAHEAYTSMLEGSQFGNIGITID